MKCATLISCLMVLGATVGATAHETGVYHAHDGASGHPAFGVDHTLILLAVAAIVGIVLWRSR